MGVCQKRQKRYPEALQNYQKLLELDEKNLIAITNIGLIHYEQGDLNLASSQFQKVSKLTPNLPKINWLSLLLSTVKAIRGKRSNSLKARLKSTLNFLRLKPCQKISGVIKSSPMLGNYSPNCRIIPWDFLIPEPFLIVRLTANLTLKTHFPLPTSQYFITF